MQKSDSASGSDLQVSMTPGLLAFQDKHRGDGQLGYAKLKIKVYEGKNLKPSDADGKSDPYCKITVGSEKKQTDPVFSTLNPSWSESAFVFRVPIPALAAKAGLGAADLVHYIIVDVWDYDRLNPDDFMGRIMIPIASLEHGETVKWYKLGTVTRGGKVSGDVKIGVSVTTAEPVGRWAADAELYTFCSAREYHLPVLAKDGLHELPGVTERVEMLLSPVLVEISQRRSVGSVYLTDYRIVISCSEDAAHKYGITIDSFTDLSMWIPLVHMESVEKFTDDKVVQNAKDQGNATTLVIRCFDFRLVRLTFFSQIASNTAANKPLLLALQKPKDDLPEAEDGSESGTSEDSNASSPDTVTTRKMHSQSLPAAVQLRSPVDGAANFQTSNQSVRMGVPFPDDAPPGRPHRRPLSMLAQMRVGKLLEQVKGQRPFGAKLNNGTNSLEKLVKAFQERLEFIVANPKEMAFQFMSEYELTPELLLGHDVYSPDQEFKRQQVSGKWAASDLNKSHKLCLSYPENLYLPAELKDEVIRSCAHFRSKHRIPTLCWYNFAQGNFIMRSSQPMPGAMGKFSVEDESVIEQARLCNPSSSSLVIFDARSLVAAEGNKFKGLGTENASRYRNCRLLHLDIGNIHAMRESIDKLRAEACEFASEYHWLSKLEDTQWLRHITVIIKGASTIARYVGEKGVALLVHCSDGWDRTTQLTSLAQLMLDPYYRTFDGFKVLVEKEWLSFGHKFKDRLGNPDCPHERSPVFLQFLDCTWQILEQFQSAFQFNSKYLRTLAELHSSGWFGTFLLNSQSSRLNDKIAEKSVSIWAHFDAIKESLMNAGYVETTEMIQPNASVRRIRLWFDFYLRCDESSWPSSILDPDDETLSRRDKQPKMVVWVPDKRAKVCHDCKRRFTHFRRRHHCRACGQVFCHECTSKRLVLPSLGYTTEQRVCDSCFKTHEVRSTDREDYVVLST